MNIGFKIAIVFGILALLIWFRTTQRIKREKEIAELMAHAKPVGKR